MSRPFGSKNKTTYILTDECANRLRAMAKARQKEPAIQMRVSKAVYDRVLKYIPHRDHRRDFVDAALTAALDAAGA